MRRLRVLLVAETVTLAHLARPLALARALAPLGVECALAADRRYDGLLAAVPGIGDRFPLATIPGARFARALARGAPLYRAADLAAYVDEDRRLIAHWRPDVVVGDFRLSLGISARLSAVPYAAIQNAYWLPAAPEPLPLPVLPWTGHLPLAWEQHLFAAGLRLAEPLHCRAYGAVARQHGLASPLRRIRPLYAEADGLLVADWPAFHPGLTLPEHARWVGPLTWSPDLAAPAWWPHLPQDRPVVYAGLGSSGPAALLPRLLAVLGGLPVTAVVSTAGQAVPDRVPANVHVAPYLDGGLAARRAALMVCNGGSLSVQQAAQAGIPVLGLACNMDQMMSMRAAQTQGLGWLLRADRADARSLDRALRGLLADAPARAAAARARALPAIDAGAEAAALLERLASGPRPHASRQRPG